jgi:hypothetical protein
LPDAVPPEATASRSANGVRATATRLHERTFILWAILAKKIQQSHLD